MNCRKPLTVEEAMAHEEEMMSFMKDFMELVAKDPELMHRFKEFGVFIVSIRLASSFCSVTQSLSSLQGV